MQRASRDPRTLTIIAAMALLVAVGTRLPYFAALPAPLNDGGMFAQIVDDLKANGMRLPTHTDYNRLHLPMSYPPLGFFLAAGASNLLAMPSAEVMKGLPLVCNLLSVLVFVLLASRLSPDRRVVAAAAFLFAVLPQTSGWLVMGGGLTRSAGFLFSLLTFVFAWEALRYRRWRDVVLTGICAGLSGLSHLESGVLVVLVLPLFGLAFGGRWRGLDVLVPAAAMALAVASPWLLWLHQTIGFQPLGYASHTSAGRTLPEALLGFFGGLVFTDRYMGLCVLVLPTAIWLLRRREWLLPAWIGVAMILVSRSAFTQVSVPAALLAARGWWVLWDWKGARVAPHLRAASWPALLVLLGLWTAIDKYIYGYRLPAIKFDVLAALSPAERGAMEWVRNHTPTDAKFLVLSERMEQWHMDMVAEWFPYFAQRHSVLTVQGREWRANEEFARWQVLSESVAQAYDVASMDAIVRQTGSKYDYVFVAGPFYKPRADLAREMSHRPDFDLLYDKGYVRIYRRLAYSAMTRRVENAIATTRTPMRDRAKASDLHSAMKPTNAGPARNAL
jgi:hypothetical protein